MAFAITQRSSGGSGETGVDSFTTASFTPTANSRLFVFATGQRTNHTNAVSWSISDSQGLSWTKLDESTLYIWNTDPNYGQNSVCYYTDIGASPAAMTVTVNAGTNSHYYAVVSFNVTGYDSATPFQQNSVDNGASASGGNSVTGTLTLGSNPTSGNLVVAMFGVGADGGGGVATPSTYSVLTNQNSSFCQNGVFYNVATTTAAITSSDLGQVVGAWGGIAFEMKLASAGPSIPVLYHQRQEQNLS